jgi:hypothetical protein
MDKKIHKIVKAIALDNYKIKIVYDDGLKKIIDLENKLEKGIAKELQNKDVFEDIKVGSSGEIYWSNGFDLCPVTLRME